MTISSETMKMIIAFLYNLEEFEACEKMLDVYERQFTAARERPQLSLIKPDETLMH